MLLMLDRNLYRYRSQFIFYNVLMDKFREPKIFRRGAVCFIKKLSTQHFLRILSFCFCYLLLLLLLLCLGYYLFGAHCRFVIYVVNSVEKYMAKMQSNAFHYVSTIKQSVFVFVYVQCASYQCKYNCFENIFKALCLKINSSAGTAATLPCHFP